MRPATAMGLAMLLSAACAAGGLRVIQASREPRPVPCASGAPPAGAPPAETCYVVTAGWLQERYELERGLRYHLEACLGREARREAHR